MYKFKVCMVGSYAVGKTSLVERFIHSIYSDRYHTTIGVKIDKKIVEADGETATCVIWDIAGEDEFYTVRNSYLNGMSGYFLVLDGTRRVTLEIAERIHSRIESLRPRTPFVLIVNKLDLLDEWEIQDEDLQRLSNAAEATFKTSAKSGDGVEQSFVELTRDMIRELSDG